MVEAQTGKFFLVTPPAAIVDNASYTTAEIDTCPGGIPHDLVEILVILGATDIAMVALKVQASDTAGSGHADVTGLVFGTSVNTDGSASTLPSATDDNKIFAFEIDMRKVNKRYLDVVATAGDGTAGTFCTILARLSRSKQVPVTAAERGIAQILRL